MSEKRITLIAAMARNRAIGLDGAMPWHLPGELAHFRRATMGKTIVMGRKTWESIGRPLPGRQNIVVTRNPDYRADGCLVVGSLRQAIEAADSDEVMVIGGGELYARALPMAVRMLLTRVHCEPEADTWFPEWDASEWRELDRVHHEADGKNEYAFDAVEYQRII